MKIYLGSDSLNDIDSVIGQKEELRLNELLIFIQEYLNDNAAVINDSLALEALPNGWFRGSNVHAKPYIQFQLHQLEKILAASINNESYIPLFNSDLSLSLQTELNYLVELTSPTFEPNNPILKWSNVQSNDANVLLDGTSIMAKQLTEENFGVKALLQSQSINQEKWAQTFKEAERILNLYIPEVIPYVQKHLRVIIPVAAEQKNISLSSTPSFNGVFLASWVSSKHMAEAIIHEVSHDCLNKISLLEPLVNDNKAGFYSPFRIDTRPASGVLHAAYSFVNVCQYLHRVMINEPRLANWAEERLASFLFNTVLCCRLLSNSNALTEQGRQLVDELNDSLDELQMSYELQLDVELLASKQKHFSAWEKQEKAEDIFYFKNIFETLISQLPTKTQNKKQISEFNFVKEESLEWLRFNYQYTQLPVVIRGETLVNIELLLTELDGIKNKEFKVLNAARHKGYANTPGKKITLKEHIDSFKNTDLSTGSEYFFSVIKNLAQYITFNIWKDDVFFKNFWFDGDNSWLFWNAKGLYVPLHNDSVNNLHCVVKGKKTFFLSPPSEKFQLDPKVSDFNDGFSEFSPFSSQELANKIGAFVTIEARDMLYIPYGWWHSILYDTDCLAVSAFDENSD
jgi:hypothetical protein